MIGLLTPPFYITFTSYTITGQFKKFQVRVQYPFERNVRVPENTIVKNMNKNFSSPYLIKGHDPKLRDIVPGGWRPVHGRSVNL